MALTVEDVFGETRPETALASWIEAMAAGRELDGGPHHNDDRTVFASASHGLTAFVSMGDLRNTVAEIKRLREANAALLAACECQEACHAWASFGLGYYELLDKLMAHGYKDDGWMADFTDNLRRKAIALAKGEQA